MKKLKSGSARWIFLFVVCFAVLSFGQGKKLSDGVEQERDHPRERDAWFRRGRPSDGGQAAEKLHRAYQQKMAKRARRVQESQAQTAVSVGTTSTSQPSVANAASLPGNGAMWVPLGPAPEASDSSTTGSQDYGPVTGRATAVAVDQNDPTGGTVYVGGAYGGLWKSTNASDPTIAACGSNPGVRCAPNVTWTPLIDNQATLAVGSIAIKPGDSGVVLVGTGESNSSADSYYGLGILRSADAGSTWNLIASAGANPFRGLAFSRIAFATETVNSLNPNVVVASTAAAGGGIGLGAEIGNTGNTTTATCVSGDTCRGLYFSTDGGVTWSYRVSVTDSGSATTIGSAHSVIYFPAQHKFYAALRAHGIYSSVDGKNWTRLAAQPGTITLTNCPTWSLQNSVSTCPLYRAELAVVPGRSEMYLWMVDANDNNQGIYQTRNGGSTWTQVNSIAIAAIGSKVVQGTYNLALAAVPDGSGTDLYAGAVDQWKAKLSDPTATSTWSAFVNLTHVYGCNPAGSYSHVHPDEHSIDFVHANPQTIYFANDGGIYRTLSGFLPATGTCGSTPYSWDNLNSTMGSMTQYVWFTNHPTSASTLLGGTQDNGSPATANAGTTQAWVSVNNGDGGYNAIDPSSPTTWYTANTYMEAGIQRCKNGINCKSSDFDASQVVTQLMVGGDYGAFYTPYMLDPQNAAKIIVGTCRVWRGNADGTNWGAGNALSYQNFDFSLSSKGACPKADATDPPYTPDNISAMAAGGPRSTVSNSSQVIWVGTEKGTVYVTTNADGGPATWDAVTGTINPNHYPISSIALDPTDLTGQTAYVTIMGFDVGHVWLIKSTDGGNTWNRTPYTGDLPNAPADAVVVDPGHPNTIYVGTDVGVFATTNSGVNWTEVGLDSTGASTFPNVAVTRLAMFSGGGTEHLRVSTYGRGVWDIDLAVPTSYGFALTVPNPTQTVIAGQPAVFTGTVTSGYGFGGDVTLSCTGIISCTIANPIQVPQNGSASFTVTVQSVPAGDTSMSIQATSGALTYSQPVVLHGMDFTLGSPTPTSVSIPRGTTSSPISLQLASVGQFQGTVSLACSGLPVGATCTFPNGSDVTLNANDAVIVTVAVATQVTTATGTSEITVTATPASGGPTPKSQQFSVAIQMDPDYVLPSPPPDLGSIKATTTASNTFSIGVQDGYTGTLALACVLSTPGTCVLPASVTPPAEVTVSVTPSVAASGAANATINITDTSSPPKAHSMALPYIASNFAVQSSGNVTALTGAPATLTFTVASQGNYSGNLNTFCEVTLPDAVCAMSPATPINVSDGGTTTVTAAVAVPQNATPGSYDVTFTATDPAQSSLVHVAHATLGAIDFSLAADPASATVRAGGSAPYQINIAPKANGTASGTVNFSCSGLPSLAACNFVPSSQLLGAGALSTKLTITTTAPSAAPTSPAYAMWLPLAGIAAIGIVVRQRRFRLALLVIAVCALVLFEGCGGGSHKVTSPGTPLGQYTVTVSGSVGSAQRTTTVTLIVQ